LPDGVIGSVIVPDNSITTNVNFAITRPVILPVSLLDFQANLVGTYAHLKWQTSLEQGASHFVVEHSKNGINYEGAAVINAVGNSNDINTYKHIHKYTQTGKNYYRLKIVDLDGKFEYSSVEVVTIQGENPYISLYPNPTHNKVTIEHPMSSLHAEIKVVDATGRILKSYPVVANTNQTEIECMGMTEGVYLLIWVDGHSTLSEKLVIF
jgi:hypothetical protein